MLKLVKIIHPYSKYICIINLSLHFAPPFAAPRSIRMCRGHLSTVTPRWAAITRSTLVIWPAAAMGGCCTRVPAMVSTMYGRVASTARPACTRQPYRAPATTTSTR